MWSFLPLSGEQLSRHINSRQQLDLTAVKTPGENENEKEKKNKK